MPYKGAIAFQLPMSAVPSQLLQQSSKTPDSGEEQGGQEQVPELMHYGTAAGGLTWVWAHFSYLKDNAKTARSKMALVSLANAGLFR
jgi:hypothetical protein